MISLEKLNFMKARRKKLAADVSMRRDALVSAERHLALVAKIEESIDGIIESVVASPAPLPASSEYRNEADALYTSVAPQLEQYVALTNLKADLPAIRAHWEAKREEALA